MKTLLKITGMLLLFAVAGCSSTYHTTGNDDIYYIPQTNRGEPEQVAHAEGGKVVEVVEETEAYSQPAGNNNTQYHADQQQGVQYVNTEVVDDTAEYYYDEDGNQHVVHNHYYGDYYDFSYASRIRRFHRPYVTFGYYDPFYTNMYFYTYNPHYYGVSIYMGYGAMPFYYPGFYWHRPWYSSWYWRPHYWHRPFHPFYYYGFGGWWGSPFWSGYHAGFYAGLHYPFGYGYGHWGYYGHNYNSFDGSNYHYGPRGSMGGTVDRSTTGRYTSSTAGTESFAHRFESRTTVNEDGRREILADSRDSAPAEARETVQRQEAQQERQTTTIADQQRPETRETQTAAAQPAQSTVQDRAREIVAEQQRATRETYQPERRVEDYRAPSREEYERTNVQRYTRPQQVSPQRRTDGGSSNYTMPRTYTSPSYQQPSTPQRTRPAPATTTRPSREQAAPRQPTQTRPATPPPSQRPSTQPSRTDDRGRPSYTPPRQQPSRSTTSPAPRSSSRSTTSPARSTPPRSSASPARSTPPRSSASPARSSSSRGSSSPARSSSSSSSRSGSSGGRNR